MASCDCSTCSTFGIHWYIWTLWFPNLSVQIRTMRLSIFLAVLVFLLYVLSQWLLLSHFVLWSSETYWLEGHILQLVLLPSATIYWVLKSFFALQYTLECHYSNPSFADLSTCHMLVHICRFIFLHLMYTDWKIRFHSACYLLMVLFIDFLNSSLLYRRLCASITASKAFPGLSIRRRLVPIFGFMLFALDMYWLENQILEGLLFPADVY